MVKSKPLTLRLEKDVWVFLKKKSVDREMSLSALITEQLLKYKKHCERTLTSQDTTV